MFHMSMVTSMKMNWTTEVMPRMMMHMMAHVVVVVMMVFVSMFMAMMSMLFTKFFWIPHNRIPPFELLYV
jgi:hypothetical protein